MRKDFTVGIATCRHDSRTYLAETDTMAPAAASKTDLRPRVCLSDSITGICNILNVKSGTLQMGF
jgi:hypothetical protein